MVRYVKRGSWAALVVLVAAAFSAGVAQAQSTGGVANGFRVSPVRSELTIEKGKNSTFTMTVENPTAVATTAKAVVNDFVASDDETGTPRLILDDTAQAPKNSFKSIVSSIPDQDLGPKEKKDIVITISIPEGASSGGYYGAVRFVPSQEAQGGNVGLTASVGTIVLVTVPGSLTEKLDLVQMSAAQGGKTKSFLTKGDIQIITRLKNDGDIHVQPFGRVEVKNMFGKTVNSFDLNNTDPRANILPGSTRKFENNVDYKKWFGRYTINANIGYSQGSGNIVSAQSSFWYVPAWALYVLAALVVAVVIGVYFLARRFSGRARHGSKK